MARIDQIQRRVLADSEKATELWRRFFGKKINFTWEETPPKDFHAGETRLSQAVVQLVNEANEHLNQNVEPNRVGETSLFIREPRNDRLVLAHSTSTALREPDGTDPRIANWDENYDPNRKSLFYSLYDRLAARRNDEMPRKKRGLTGWIAVSGHYLLVNGEQDSVILDLISKIRPETAPACNRYGPPFWGRRMSEAPNDPTRPKRYLGVPVKSVDSPELTIGVLRYACPLEGAELTVNDLAFLEEISSILSALLHLECTKVRALREAELPHQVERLKRNGNLHEFLSFMSVGLRSQIISAYLDIGQVIGENSCVRLVDAVGIDSTVSKHRMRLRDYTGDENPPGFTWWLFKDAPLRPTVRTSVVQDESWRGYNTEVFYRSALSALGIKDDHHDIRKAVTQYRIKIMGMPVSTREGENIGVLKAEFPASFYDVNHYDRDDINFFSQCALVVGEHLKNIAEVLSGRCFEDHQVDHGVFFRALTDILRTNLVQENEAKEFWSRLGKFLEKNEEKLRIEGLQTFRDVPGPIRRELERSLMEVVRELPNTLTRLLESILKTALFGGG